MRSTGAVSVRVQSFNRRDLEARLEKVTDCIRRRAYTLYCTRGGKTALDNWVEAEGELNPVHLAGVADEQNEIRITACVPETNPCDVAVDVLPDEIVVEADRGGEVERYKRFVLPAKIDAGDVQASMHGVELDIIAAKLKNVD